jgi:4-amino-4-deoxy-L-arabinose transferase-like glycosyltransferase
MKKRVVNWLKNNWILVLILLIGAFLRLYKINEFMTFLGDEGRDAIVVRNLLIKADLILIGPGTSIGSMYLGPLYYYFMAPFLFLFNFSPVGPAVEIALLGVITIFLIYKVSKEWFGETAAIFSSTLYAISPVVIIYSRSSWNPNIMPFFALLSVYSIWKVWKEKKYNWLIVTGISYAFVLQSHYLGLLLAPVLFIYWLISKVPVKYTLIAGSVFLFLMSPLFIFDIRHDWMNTKAFYKFLTVRQETVSIKPWKALPNVYPIFVDINTSLLTGKNILVGKIITPLIILFLVWLIAARKRIKQFNKPLLILIIWLGFALLGLALYKQHIYDHYFGFIFPALFILLGFILQFVYKTKFKILTILIFLILVFVNLKNSPILFSPNRQLQRSENVSKDIINKSLGEAFNFAVVAERNYEDGYQYFLEKENSKMVEIDPQIPESVKTQLFVVCEMEEKKCDPTHSSKAEVANFGWSKIDSMWEVDGVIIYKLIHTK